MKKVIFSVIAGSSILFTACGEKATEEVKHEEHAPVEAPVIEGTYNLAEGSVVTWSAKHIQDTAWAHIGTIATSGSIEVTDGAATGATLEFDAASIAENEESAANYGEWAPKLLVHLSDSTFFNTGVAANPTFVLTGLNDGTATGTITVVGMSQDISFPAEVTVTEDQVSVSGEVTLDFLPFGMAGIPDASTLDEEQKAQAVSNEVLINIEVSASKAQS